MAAAAAAGGRPATPGPSILDRRLMLDMDARFATALNGADRNKFTRHTVARLLFFMWFRLQRRINSAPYAPPYSSSMKDLLTKATEHWGRVGWPAEVKAEYDACIQSLGWVSGDVSSDDQAHELLDKLRRLIQNLAPTIYGAGTTTVNPMRAAAAASAVTPSRNHLAHLAEVMAKHPTLFNDPNNEEPTLGMGRTVTRTRGNTETGPELTTKPPSSHNKRRLSQHPGAAVRLGSGGSTNGLLTVGAVAGKVNPDAITRAAFGPTRSGGGSSTAVYTEGSRPSARAAARDRVGESRPQASHDAKAGPASIETLTVEDIEGTDWISQLLTATSVAEIESYKGPGWFTAAPISPFSDEATAPLLRALMDGAAKGGAAAMFSAATPELIAPLVRGTALSLPVDVRIVVRSAQLRLDIIDTVGGIGDAHPALSERLAAADGAEILTLQQALAAGNPVKIRSTVSAVRILLARPEEARLSDEVKARTEEILIDAEGVATTLENQKRTCAVSFATWCIAACGALLCAGYPLLTLPQRSGYSAFNISATPDTTYGAMTLTSITAGESVPLGSLTVDPPSAANAVLSAVDCRSNATWLVAVAPNGTSFVPESPWDCGVPVPKGDGFKLKEVTLPQANSALSRGSAIPNVTVAAPEARTSVICCVNGKRVVGLANIAYRPIVPVALTVPTIQGTTAVHMDLLSLATQYTNGTAADMPHSTGYFFGRRITWDVHFAQVTEHVPASNIPCVVTLTNGVDAVRVTGISFTDLLTNARALQAVLANMPIDSRVTVQACIADQYGRATLLNAMTIVRDPLLPSPSTTASASPTGLPSLLASASPSANITMGVSHSPTATRPPLVPSQSVTPSPLALVRRVWWQVGNPNGTDTVLAFDGSAVMYSLNGVRQYPDASATCYLSTADFEPWPSHAAIAPTTVAVADTSAFRWPASGYRNISQFVLDVTNTPLLATWRSSFAFGFRSRIECDIVIVGADGNMTYSNGYMLASSPGRVFASATSSTSPSGSTIPSSSGTVSPSPNGLPSGAPSGSPSANITGAPTANVTYSPTGTPMALPSISASPAAVYVRVNDSWVNVTEGAVVAPFQPQYGFGIETLLGSQSVCGNMSVQVHGQLPWVLGGSGAGFLPSDNTSCALSVNGSVIALPPSGLLPYSIFNTSLAGLLVNTSGIPAGTYPMHSCLVVEVDGRTRELADVLFGQVAVIAKPSPSATSSATASASPSLLSSVTPSASPPFFGFNFTVSNWTLVQGLIVKTPIFQRPFNVTYLLNGKAFFPNASVACFAPWAGAWDLANASNAALISPGLLSCGQAPANASAFLLPGASGYQPYADFSAELPEVMLWTAGAPLGASEVVCCFGDAASRANRGPFNVAHLAVVATSPSSSPSLAASISGSPSSPAMTPTPTAGPIYPVTNPPSRQGTGFASGFLPFTSSQPSIGNKYGGDPALTLTIRFRQDRLSTVDAGSFSTGTSSDGGINYNTLTLTGKLSVLKAALPGIKLRFTSTAVGNTADVEVRFDTKDSWQVGARPERVARRERMLSGSTPFANYPNPHPSPPGQGLTIS